MIRQIKPEDDLYIYYFEGIIYSNEDNFIDNPDFIGNWVEQESSFLFFSSPVEKFVQQILEKQQHARLVDMYEMTYEQWHGDKIGPYVIGNLLVTPPWNREHIEKSNLKQVILDPGVVFGTGKHTTTEDCLSILNQLVKKEKISSVMDIGSGTGLLSVGAAMLGAKSVLACDFNFLAAKTTLNNVKLNSFEKNILVAQAKGEEFIDLYSDVVVANIHYDVMKDIIEAEGFLTKKWFILSGLLRTQTKTVLATLKNKPVKIIEHRCPDGIWNTILGRVKVF